MLLLQLSTVSSKEVLLQIEKKKRKLKKKKN
jgi:hypothetical protein